MKRALVVEDLPEIRQWLAELAVVAFAGLQVVSAARRDEGLALVHTQQFDLALIDLGLPDGSGADVVGALRAHHP